MKQKVLLLVLCLLIGAAPSFATKVTFYDGMDVAKLINKATGVETIIPYENYHATFDIEPGEYIYTENSVEDGLGFCDGSFELTIKNPEDYPNYSEKTGKSFFLGAISFSVSFSSENDADGKRIFWQRDVDYTLENLRVIDENGNLVNSIPYKAFANNEEDKNSIYVQGLENWTVEADFVPTALHPEYATTSMTTSMRAFGGSTTYVRFTEKMTFVMTFPEDATGALSFKKSQTHYVAFQDVEPTEKELVNGMWYYKYAMAKNSNEYCYRISRLGNMTRAGIFQPQNVDTIKVTEETLAAETDHYFNHDVWGNGTNYADIYLNINKRNLLRLKKDDTFQIVNLRTWQLTNNATANYFVEPDYNWTVLNSNFEPDNSVIEIDNKGVITAKAPGTAIVQVRYTALGLGAMGGDKWSELWAENTGTFVVTVDADDAAAPADNIRLAYKPENELDAEHDILYYMDSTPGYYLTFTPAAGSTVAVANPEVDGEKNTVAYPNAFSSENVTTNADGSVTVLLTFGRNIIRTTDASGNANYQVLSAKPVTVEPFTSARTDKYLLPGDDVKVQFKGLYHVSGKLAGIYNNNCHLCFNDYIVFKGTLLGAGQYDFAGNAVAQQFPFTFASDATEDYVMTGGCLVPEGYGSAPGTHRAISYTLGVDPNFNAGVVSGYFGIIPDQVVKLTQLKDAGRLSLVLQLGSRGLPVKMEAIHHAFGEKAGWVMDEGAIARVDNTTGEVFPVKGGKTSMKVVADTANPDTEALLVCDIEVEPNDDFIPVEGISFSSDVKEIKMNFSWGNWGNMNNTLSCTVTPANATNKQVIFTSSHPEIVALTKQGAGTLTANGYTSLFWNDATKEPGESVITAETVDGGYKAQIVVRWLRAADNIKLSESEIELAVGDAFDLYATVSPDNVDERYKPSWSSDNGEVANVDQQGMVLAVGPGEAYITVRIAGSSYDVTSRCKVTVKETSGVENVAAEKDSFTFWPNPAQSTLYVRTVEAARAEIYSLSGSLVMTAELEEGINTLDVSALTAGSYIIRVGDKAQRLIRR